MLVIAGLAFAPMATPAAAMASAHAGMDMSSMSADMSSMPADMPCCPDEKGSCPDCPLAAICVLKVAPAAPALAGAVLMRLPTKTAHSVSDDAAISGLDRPPPDHPPRNLV
jgi:hypothetical protein